MTPEEARQLLEERRVVTDNLTVESIFEAYADRLCVAYPDNAKDIIEERDVLLAWWVVQNDPKEMASHLAVAIVGAGNPSQYKTVGQHATAIITELHRQQGRRANG